MGELKPIKIVNALRTAFKNRPWLIAFTALGGMEILVLLWGLLTNHGFGRRYLLLAASTTFILAAIAGGALSILYGRLIALALVFCWLGDYAGSYIFLLSIASFLAAHLALIAAFFLHGVERQRLFKALAVFVPISVGIFLWLNPYLTEVFYYPVIAYIVVITIMASCAFGARPSPVAAILVWGACLFYISDIFVARARFVSPGVVNSIGCYPLYYSACFLFAISPAACRNQDPTISEP
ncbi:MAG: lysoplasmalogenase [Candidatus Omnitrophota bacterium]